VFPTLYPGDYFVHVLAGLEDFVDFNDYASFSMVPIYYASKGKNDYSLFAGYSLFPVKFARF
jgi:hypothetical protein